MGTIKTQSSRGRTLAVVTAAMALFIVLGTYHSIFSYLAFLVGAAIMVFAPQETSVCLLLFTVSFASVFKSSPGTQSFFTVLMLAFVAIQFFRSGRISAPFLMTLFALVFCLLVGSAASFHIVRLIKVVMNLLFVCFALKADSEENHRRFFLSYILGVIAASLVSFWDIIPNLEAYAEIKYLGNTGYQVIRFTGLYGDPNYYSINVIVSLCLVVLLHHRKELGGLVSAGLAAVLIYFAAITYSKSAFLMLLFPCVLFLYASSKDRRHFFRRIFIAVAVVLGFLLIARQFDIFATVLSRFDRVFDFSSATSGRTALWQAYLEYCLEHGGRLLIGNGLGAGLIDGTAAHSLYLDVIYYLGLLGGICWAALVVMLVNMPKVTIKRGILNYSVGLCIAVMYFFLSQLFYFDFAVQLLLAIVVMNIHFDEKMERAGT